MDSKANEGAGSDSGCPFTSQARVGTSGTPIELTYWAYQRGADGVRLVGRIGKYHPNPALIDSVITTSRLIGMPDAAGVVQTVNHYYRLVGPEISYAQAVTAEYEMPKEAKDE